MYLLELYEEIKEYTKILYTTREEVFSIGLSGGKDSSLVFCATMEAILELPREQITKDIYVLYSDTLMELQPIQIHTYKMLENIKKFALENDLPIKVLHAKPEITERFFSLLIAKGMRPPSKDARFCTTRLKIDVQKKLLYDTFGTEDIATISIVGSRKEESHDRRKRLERGTIDENYGGHLKQHKEYSKSLVFAPIENLTTEEVWTLLRLSIIGIEIIDAEGLYEIYATTQGEGEECQTVLGNAKDNGKKPNCSASGGRFGCWVCPLLGVGGDKALIGMSKQYVYIHHLINFRDWVVSIRDGNWHKYRDVYNHKNFMRLQYNIDNHRFGQNSPGGLNLGTRAEMLTRLLDTESLVQQDEDITLITDEELNYCQHRWIQEGDISCTAVQIAKKFNRKIEISKSDLELIAYAKALIVMQDIWESKVVFWYKITPNERFAIQFVKQIREKYSIEKVVDICKELHYQKNSYIVSDHLQHLQLKNQFYPSESLEKMVRREWENDYVSFVTQALIHDYEDTWSEEAKELQLDPLENPDISMEDKYAMLDNWSYYQGEDTNEDVEHPDYMRFGGNRQYIKFRERLSEENIAKKVLKVKKRKAKNNPLQGTFDFSAA